MEINHSESFCHCAYNILSISAENKFPAAVNLNAAAGSFSFALAAVRGTNSADKHGGRKRSSGFVEPDRDAGGYTIAGKCGSG